MKEQEIKFSLPGYELSTDYNLLWDLIFKGLRVPAYLIYTNKYVEPIWDLVEVKKAYMGREGDYSIGTRGVGYEGSRTLNGFISVCKLYSLHFIIPNINQPNQ